VTWMGWKWRLRTSTALFVMRQPKGAVVLAGLRQPRDSARS
jgi:hypothetical protein